MTGAELDRAISRACRLPRWQALAFLAALADAIGEALDEGEKVTIAGFGVWEIRERAARTARDPNTGEPVAVPARRVVRFRQGKHLAERVVGREA